MILSYSKESFEYDIIGGIKKHTFRADPFRRWKPGMRIQHWMGSPRNQHRAKKIPYCFLDGECQGVQEVRMYRNFHLKPVLMIDGKNLTDRIEEIAKNDGLTIQEFVDWFIPEITSTWTGRCIHFTDLKY